MSSRTNSFLSPIGGGVAKIEYVPDREAGVQAQLLSRIQAPRQSVAAMMPPTMSARPPASSAPSYLAPAVAAGTARSVPLEEPLPLSATAPIRPMLTGLEGLYIPALDRNPATEAAMAADRFSAAVGAAAAHRSAALAAIQARPPPYSYSLYSAPVALPPPLLPHTSPHEATPFITKNFFPQRLFEVLSLGEHAHIIAWLPHGKGFMIHDKPRFATMVLPWHFKGVKFSSFVRRLSRWKFARVPRGPERGAYYHEHFVRNRPDLLLKMFCPEDGQFEESKKKGKGIKESETEDLDEHVEEQEGGEVKRTLPENEDQRKSGHKPQVQTHSTPAKVPSPESRPADNPIPEGKAAKIPGPEGKAQSPNALSKTTQAAEDIAAALEKINRFVTSPDKILVSHPADTRLQMGYPTSELRAISNGRPPEEFQRKLLLSPPMLPSNNEPSASPRSANTAHILSSRSDLISNQAPYAAAPITGPKIISANCAGLPTTAPGVHETWNLREEPRTIREASAGGVVGDGVRAVMMSQEERDEFAKYLMLKRTSATTFQRPTRN